MRAPWRRVFDICSHGRKSQERVWDCGSRRLHCDVQVTTRLLSARFRPESLTFRGTDGPLRDDAETMDRTTDREAEQRAHRLRCRPVCGFARLIGPHRDGLPRGASGRRPVRQRFCGHRDLQQGRHRRPVRSRASQSPRLLHPLPGERARRDASRRHRMGGGVDRVSARRIAVGPGLSRAGGRATALHRLGEQLVLSRAAFLLLSA